MGSVISDNKKYNLHYGNAERAIITKLNLPEAPKAEVRKQDRTEQL